MLKKLLNLGLLGLIILFTLPNLTYAQSDSNNLFESFDKVYEERLNTAKSTTDEQVALHNHQSLEELHSHEDQ
jgi:hypothetical protein